MRERLLVLAETGEHDAHVVERARFLPRHPDGAIDHERLGVALNRVLELAHVPRRGAALVQDRRACDEDGVGGRAVFVSGCSMSTSASACSARRQRLLRIADQTRDHRRADAVPRPRRACPLPPPSRTAGRARPRARRRRLADVDVELRERGSARSRACPARRAHRPRCRIAWSSRQRCWAALREPAQDLLAQAVGGEPSVVIVERQELERARQLAERVGVAAESTACVAARR